MKNKMIIVLALVAMLSLAGVAQAYTYSWCSSSGDWADPARWDVMPSPTVAGCALIYNGAILNVTTNGQGTNDCALGYVPGGATVNVAAGITWTCSGSLMLGHDGGTGVFNISGTVYANGNLRMSTNAVGGGTVNVDNGGTFIVGGTGGGAINIGEAAPASINLKGSGSMIVNGDGGWHLEFYGGRGHIDIESGELKVLGNYVSALQTRVDSGWITSHGGGSPHCALAVSFLDGYTYVKTVGCVCTTYLPADVNHDCYVDMLDLALLAQNWLDCTVATDPACVQ